MPETPDLLVATPVRAVSPAKARAAAGGGLAGGLAAIVVARIPGVHLDELEAGILTTALTTGFAYAAAYARQVGPVVLRRIGLPEPDSE